MRLLVGVACIAIIAAVGYYFFSEYSEAKARDAYAERQSVVRGCQTIAESMPYGSMAKYCREQGYVK